MRSLLSKLWADDKGATISAELILVLTLLVVGLIPGLIALRNTENAALATAGNMLLAIQTGFSFAPFTIVGVGGNTIATVDGGSYDVVSTNVLVSSSVGVTPSFTTAQVNPAP